MGMFDYITGVPEVKCRKCGEPVTHWQSKDGECHLMKLAFWEVQNFYSACSKCKTWHEFRCKTPPLPRPKKPFSDFELIEPNEDVAT
jgi:hypothetical protein